MNCNCSGCRIVGSCTRDLVEEILATTPREESPVVDLMLSEREQVNVYLCFEVLRKATLNVRNLEHRLVY